MKLIRAATRFFLLLSHVLLGIAFAIIQPLLPVNSWQTLVEWWLRIIVRILGGRVTVKGEPARSGVLMVANHVSWLDIPLLGGYSFVRFLSKYEVKNWPVIGWLASRAGTLYIERGKQGAARQAAASISDSLNEGDVVLIFPEGTTSNGRDVLPFHARLFSTALEAGVPIQPVAIRYRNAADEVCDKVPYIDEMSLFSNLLGFLGERTLHMEIHYMTPIAVADYQEHTRKTLAGLAEQQIRDVVIGVS
ncbi:MAG: lysophospholipid acyltransferase family protein [Thiolinea sp.]